MSITLRLLLVAVSLLMMVFVIRKLRKTALEIQSSIFWVGLAALLIIAAAVPGLVYWASDTLGFTSPSNFVYFCGIMVVLAHSFTQELKIALLKKKLTTLVQTIALEERRQDTQE